MSLPDVRPALPDDITTPHARRVARLIVHIVFPAKVVYIKFFGTHDEYDDVDATTVDDFSDIVDGPHTHRPTNSRRFPMEIRPIRNDEDD